jgi:SAM-dependent methyltransferase
MKVRPVPFFDQQGIAELYDWRTRSYRSDFELLGRLASGATSGVLDVACGAGRATRFLATTTRPVVGIDRSPRMLNLARARTADLAHPPRFVQGDVTSLPLRGQFSLATMVCNSFADLVLPEDQLRCLQNLRDCLATDGRILIDVTPARDYERIDGTPIEMPCPGPWESMRVECRLLSVIRSPRVRCERISYRFFDGTLLKGELHAEHERALIDHARFLDMAERAGLTAAEVLGSYTCDPYIENSPWQIYILRRLTA